MKTYPKNTYKIIGWKPKDNCFSLVGWREDARAAVHAAKDYTIESQEPSQIESLGKVVARYSINDLKDEINELEGA